ncbi:MAG: alpha/beta hydrolase family protein [Ardenticatenaceae bacterium]
MRYSIKLFPPFFMVVGLLLTAFFLLPSSMAVADTSLKMPTVKVDIDHDGDCEGDCAAIAGGQTMTGTIDGANYLIRVPANWDNGTLVVYAHGYRDKADHAGETDNTTAEAAPGGTGMEDALLAMGYAVAGSAYRDNGWAVQEGISDTLALTNHFSNTVGAPDKTILWGFSMGSVVTFKSIELYPDVYDGAIPACAVGAGATKSWDSALAMALAYDVLFDWPAEWGTVTDVADDLDFETQVRPVLITQVQDPANRGKFEFMRLLGGLPAEQFYDGANWLFTDMFFFTEARAELERRAGGPATQNLNHTYSLTDEQKTYLQNDHSLNADPFLTQMNDRTNISADANARAYLEQYADYTGNIQRPVITLHTDKDGLVSVANESVYRDTVAAANQSDRLYQAYTESVGHCTFSGEQLIATLSAMDTWLSTGTAPTAASFPEAVGFIPDFEPPAWPISIPSNQTMMGTIDGANYRIRVPANWDNGTLVVYAHGYRDKADHAGETDDTSVEAAPGGTGMEDALLAMGYAVAGSAYRDNGWAVQEGISDTLALTNHFSDTVGAPDKTILWGFSMGSVVTFKSIELYPDVYDGAIPACAVGAGATKSWDSALAMALAYDVLFDWPAEWGTVTDVADDLDFETQVRPVLITQVQDPANRGKFEFMRLLGGLPAEQFYDGTNWLFTDMFFFTEGRAELERRAGGPATQNLDHTYSLTDEQKTYLQNDHSLNADPFLTQMNERTNISADPSARAYLEQYANYTGNIQRPVITLHTEKDGLVPVANESVYSDTVAAAGQSDRLYQAYTESVGHCTFTPQQLIATLSAMDNWLAGTAPTAANFPAAAGFMPDFEPAAWPIAIEADPTNVSLAEFSGQAPSGTGWLALLPMLMVTAGLLYLRRRKA